MQFISLYGQAAEMIEDSQLLQNLKQQENENRKLSAKLNLLSDEVAKLKKEKDDLKLTAQKAENEVHALKTSQHQMLKCEKEVSYSQGVTECREKIFLTPVGQDFLRCIKDGLIQQYRHSPAYLKDVGSFAYSLAAFGFDQAMNLIVHQGYKGDVNKTKILKDALPNMTLPPALADIPKLPKDYAWWLGPMKKVVQNLAFSPHLTADFIPSPNIEFPVLDEDADDDDDYD